MASSAPPSLSVPEQAKLDAGAPGSGTGLIELEEAISQATAMLDLLMTKIVDEDRAGETTYRQSPWVGNLACLAARVEVDLRDAFEAHHKALRSA